MVFTLSGDCCLAALSFASFFSLLAFGSPLPPLSYPAHPCPLSPGPRMFFNKQQGRAHDHRKGEEAAAYKKKVSFFLFSSFLPLAHCLFLGMTRDFPSPSYIPLPSTLSSSLSSFLPSSVFPSFLLCLFFLSSLHRSLPLNPSVSVRFLLRHSFDSTSLDSCSLSGIKITLFAIAKVSTGPS